MKTINLKQTAAKAVAHFNKAFALEKLIDDAMEGKSGTVSSSQGDEWARKSNRHWAQAFHLLSLGWENAAFRKLHKKHMTLTVFFMTLNDEVSQPWPKGIVTIWNHFYKAKN